MLADFTYQLLANGLGIIFVTVCLNDEGVRTTNDPVMIVLKQTWRFVEYGEAINGDTRLKRPKYEFPR